VYFANQPPDKLPSDKQRSDDRDQPVPIVLVPLRRDSNGGFQNVVQRNLLFQSGEPGLEGIDSDNLLVQPQFAVQEFARGVMEKPIFSTETESVVYHRGVVWVRWAFPMKDGLTTVRVGHPSIKNQHAYKIRKVIHSWPAAVMGVIGNMTVWDVGVGFMGSGKSHSANSSHNGKLRARASFSRLATFGMPLPRSIRLMVVKFQFVISAQSRRVNPRSFRIERSRRPSR
jgi:hypothetical protein